VYERLAAATTWLAAAGGGDGWRMVNDGWQAVTEFTRRRTTLSRMAQTTGGALNDYVAWQSRRK
jgi:hypothetical protein